MESGIVRTCISRDIDTHHTHTHTYIYIIYIYSILHMFFLHPLGGNKTDTDALVPILNWLPHLGGHLKLDRDVAEKLLIRSVGDVMRVTTFADFMSAMSVMFRSIYNGDDDPCEMSH